MTAEVEHILEQALRLSREERAGLVAVLADTLEEGTPGEVEDAWRREAFSRIEAWRRGQLGTVASADAMAWYMERSWEVARSFFEDYSRTEALIVESPTRWQEIDKGVRRLPFRRCSWSPSCTNAAVRDTGAIASVEGSRRPS